MNFKQQILGVSAIVAVLSMAPASAGVLGGDVGGALGGGLTGIGAANGMGSFGGTLDRPGAIDRVGSATRRATDRTRDVAGAAGVKLQSRTSDVKSAVKEKAEQPASGDTTPTAQPSKSLDLGGTLGGDLDTSRAGASGSTAGNAKASREEGLSLDGQSTGATRVGPKPAEPTTP